MEPEYNLSKEVEKNKSYTVAKANSLVREAKYNMSLGQQRMLNFLISRISPQARSFDDIGSPARLGWISFQIQEFARVFDMDPDSGTTYRTVKEWLLTLKKRAWWTKIDGKDKIMSWLDEVEIEPNSGKCSVTFFRPIEPYLVALTESGNYTSFSLLYTTRFKSSYSDRFYELFKSYEFRSKVKSSSDENVKEVVFRVDELRSKFDEKEFGSNKVTNSLANYSYGEFKRVLDRCLKEINQYTDIDVTYEPIKKGRSVYQLKFFVRSVMGDELLDRTAACKRDEMGFSTKKQVEGQLDFLTPLERKITVIP